MTNLPPVQELSEAIELADRLDAHMGKQDVPVLLADCRRAAATIRALTSQHSRAAEAVAPVFDDPYAGPFTGQLSAGQPIRWQVKCTNIADEWFTDEGSADQWANSPGHYDAEIVVWIASPSPATPGMETLRQQIYAEHLKFADLRDREQGTARLQAQAALDATAQILRLFPRTDTPNPALVEQP